MASAIGYARISVNLDEGERSLDAQIVEIRRFVSKNGYQVKRVYRERSSDWGRPLTKTRPLLIRALAQAKKHHHPVIVAEFSRIRPSFAAGNAERWAATPGILCISAKPGEH